MSRIKVAYVGHDLSNPPLEGHHIASRRIIDASINSGIDSTVFSIEQKLESSKRKNFISIKSNIKQLGFNFLFLPGIASAFDDLLSTAKILREIQSLQPDLVHVLNLNKEVFLLVQYLMRMKKPVLFHFFHSPYVLKDDVFLIRNLAFKTKLYAQSNCHLLTINHALAKHFVQSAGISQEKVHFLPYPVDSKKFAPSNKQVLRLKHGVPLDRPTVVYVGALLPSRGLFTLLKAISYILSRIPNILLYVSHPQRKGEECYADQFQRIVRRLNLQRNVVFCGPCREIEEIYNLADAVVLPFNRPYWVDPPLVLLEAMSCGVPIITRSVGAIEEVVTDRNAVLASFDDPRLLAEKITALLFDNDKAERLGRNARDTIVQEYSLEFVERKLQKLYFSIIEE